MENQILTTANDLFTQYGIKSIRMDDIAKELAISKKTIYIYYKDKNHLVETLMLSMIQQKEKLIHQISDETLNAIYETIKILDSVVAMMTSINPSFFYDMQKYHKNAWLIFEKFREDFVFKKISNTLERGIQEGYFRKDISIPILAKFRIATLQTLFNPNFYSPIEFRFPDLFKETSLHFLYGCATIKGHKLINTYLNTIEDN